MGVEDWMKALMDKVKELLKGIELDPWTNYATDKSKELVKIIESDPWTTYATDKSKELAKVIESYPWTSYATEKLIQTQTTVEVICKILMNKVDNVFPPGKRVELIQQGLNVAKPYAKTGGVVLLVIIIFRLLCRGGGGGSGKMMKAPGRNYRMPRANFERNPKGYFRGLRE